MKTRARARANLRNLGIRDPETDLEDEEEEAKGANETCYYLNPASQCNFCLAKVSSFEMLSLSVSFIRPEVRTAKNTGRCVYIPAHNRLGLFPSLHSDM